MDDFDDSMIVDRWVEPFNFIEDVFRVRDVHTNELVPYKAYPYVVDFMRDGFGDLNLDRIVLKSRQIGFSTAMELEAIMTCLTFPDVEVSVVSHQYEAAKKIVAACGRMIKDAVIPLPVDEKNIQKEKITFNNGSRIVPYSSNPDSLRSENIIKAYLDEFAFFPDQQGLLAAVQPKVSRGGSITITSTPLSNNDEFMRLFNKSHKGESRNMKAYYHPFFEPGTVDAYVSLYDQPHLVPLCADIGLDRPESIREQSPERFLQEYMCIPIDDSVAYYPYSLVSKCVNDDLIAQKRSTALSEHRSGYVYMGIDIALAHDETAIVVVYVENGVHYLVHHETTQAEYREQLRLIRNVYQQFRPERIRCDATGTMGIQVERDLRNMFGYVVEGVTYTNSIKQDMAMRLKMYLQNTPRGFSPSIYISGDKELLTQLQGVKIDVTSSGNVVFSGKDGGGLDDIVNALWMALPPEHHERMGSPYIQSRTVDTMPDKTVTITGNDGYQYVTKVTSNTKNRHRRSRSRPRTVGR